MVSSPPPQLLLLAVHVLPPPLQAVSHIPQLVSDYLMPVTISGQGHLNMLEWLRVNYPRLGRPAEEMKAAEENGRAEIVRFLLRNGRVRHEDRGNAFVAAAANGHVAVAEVCLDVIGFSRDAPIAAAANNQVPVLRLLMQSDPNARSYFTVIDVLEKAVEGGNVDTSELLIEAADEWSIKQFSRRLR